MFRGFFISFIIYFRFYFFISLLSNNGFTIIDVYLLFPIGIVLIINSISYSLTTLSTSLNLHTLTTYISGKSAFILVFKRLDVTRPPLHTTKILYFFQIYHQNTFSCIKFLILGILSLKPFLYLKIFFL